MIPNQSYFVCPSCATPHYLFESSAAFHSIAAPLDGPILGDLPLVKGVSVGEDNGVPYVLTSSKEQGRRIMQVGPCGETLACKR